MMACLLVSSMQRETRNAGLCHNPRQMLDLFDKSAWPRMAKSATPKGRDAPSPAPNSKNPPRRR
ncbi:MAG: hypothetical protein BWZ10_02299 [candidate division BRC1 bacterium ADurb.BinA364]|nr:MAG: hypothetical protein BWZ10_02299 [candidate division BRC1 bacterium ADurb.BinA364]